MILIIAGVVLGVVLLATINETNVLGFSCYHFGTFTMQTFCLKSGVYYGALGVAGAMVVLGLALLIRKNGTAARP